MEIPAHSPRPPRRIRTLITVSRVLAVGALVLAAPAMFAACGGSESGDDNGGGTGISAGGKAGSAGKAGASGKGGASGASGKAGSGTGGSLIGGSGGSTGGSAGSTGGAAGKSGSSAGGAGGKAGGGPVGGAAGAGGSQCTPEDPPPATIKKTCRPATDNECDSGGAMVSDPEGAGTANPNGNGFDDDCDGLVDEGCPCAAAGTTKDCFLVPSSQTNGPPKYEVQGWCNPNAKGKVECAVYGSGEFKELKWKGECKGAQQPPDNDQCNAGDFNCDGVPLNPPGGCKCIIQNPVTCPNPIFTKPFPDPTKVGQFSSTPDAPQTIDGVDGHSWIDPKIMDPAKTTNWRWTVTGGPCDDILPNPTFGVFPTQAATWSSKLGVKKTGLPLVPDKGQPDPEVGMMSTIKNKQGWILKGDGTPSKVYPAFSLSGDYYVTGKFNYPDPNDPTKIVEGQCTQVVKVRAPGLRVELCWPEVGGNKNDNDVDLHVARLQGNAAGDGKHGWFTTAGAAPNADDCYYSPNSACSNRVASGKDAATWTPKWYPADKEISPYEACHGWGSRRFGKDAPGGLPERPCSNPRLDRDNITCDPSIDDPNSAEADPQQQGDQTGNFCGPENINIDGQALSSGERFAIGVQCYNCVQGNNGDANAQPAHPRVNIYCDGELKLGFGYDPTKMSGAEQFPALWTEGQTYNGSMWQVGVVTWNGTADNPCTITPSSSGPEWKKDEWHQKSDGSEFVCVNNGSLDSGGGNYNPQPQPMTIDWKFQTDGMYPANADALCSY